jgi:uncharacterized protein (DUF488 family)
VTDADDRRSDDGGKHEALTSPFFTIGHSTRSIPDMIGLLSSVGIRTVADVRTVPRSRTNPQFNRDTLPADLAQHRIAYEHIAALGGLRGRQRVVDGSPNPFWTNEGFRNYADYALTPAFRAGLQRLVELGEAGPIAIMCAEAVWWRCHRRIIADYLLAAGFEAFHIMDRGKIEAARMTPAARCAPGGRILYG